MIGILGGVFGGISGVIFIYLLNLAQSVRLTDPRWIWILPVAGLLIAMMRGVPKLVIGSFLTHLGGGSTGREGAVILLSQKWAELYSTYFKWNPRQSRALVLVSVGSGFGAALGAPLAGMIFGVEYLRSPWFRPRLMLQLFLAAAIAQLIVRGFNAPHFEFQAFITPTHLIKFLAYSVFFGILIGILTRVFDQLRKSIQNLTQGRSPHWIGFSSGLLLSLLYLRFDLSAFQGLGFETVQSATESAVSPSVPILKLLISSFTLATGFQGGQFIPLAFIGSTLGSSLSFADPASIALLTALGWITPYGTLTRTPYASILLACECFGIGILPFASLCVATANRVMTKMNGLNDPTL